MNIQEYISSGIVESYVLGLASNEERLAFEQLCATHAELRQAREAFEISLEQHAQDNAVVAPAGLKQKIWDGINLGTAVSPPINRQPADNTTRPLTPVRSVSFAKFLAAASIILLLGSTLLNFYFYNQYKSSETSLKELIASNQQMANNNINMQTKLQQYETSLELIRDTNMAIIAMKGQPVAPRGLTTVYWNKQTKDVYLLINNLPQPAAGKQYQLWAIVDGVPVDAGLLETNAPVAFVKMKNIPKAQAFAITLENTGGNKTPTMPIYVVGKT
ncbi:MAG TPA: anti-sigma factor [Chitinophagaceae bacterium]|nr:anti-sigma factor [Chitinophagaceae bacterium]